VKLPRPGFGSPHSSSVHRQRDGVTAIAIHQSWLRNSSAATAAPLWLRHAGPAVQLTRRPLGRALSRPVERTRSYCAGDDVSHERSFVYATFRDPPHQKPL